MKKPQFQHQREDFARSADLEAFAWFWEMGLGKSKQMIDTIVHLFRGGKIDAVFLLAPNGVHANFLEQEVPAHWPDDVPIHELTYYSDRAKTREQQRGVLDIMRDQPVRGVRVLTMSYDGACTEAGSEVALDFMKKYGSRCVMILDESSMIKTPRSKRSKRALTLGKLAAYRRIADGTPVAEGPFDIYNQLAFLYPDYWKRHGMSNYFVFKNMFGKFQKRRGSQGHQYDALLGYQNIEYLQKLISDVSTRYLKEDCLDLPPKMYTKLVFKLTPAQRATYDELRMGFRAELESGVVMEATSAMVRLLRLQQIASGYAVATEMPQLNAEYVPNSPEEAIERLQEIMDGPPARRVQTDLMPAENNPRLQITLSYLETVHHKAIVFCRFTRDVELLTQALGNRSVRYDGEVSDRDRTAALDAFRAPGGPQFLIANVAALSRGVTLVIAKTVVYYTNDFRLILRLQSEDRAHRIGQDEKVQYVDIEAQDTVDCHIIKTLREKFDLAAMVTGDRLREWIS